MRILSLFLILGLTVVSYLTLNPRFVVCKHVWLFHRFIEMIIKNMYMWGHGAIRRSDVIVMVGSSWWNVTLRHSFVEKHQPTCLIALFLTCLLILETVYSLCLFLYLSITLSIRTLPNGLVEETKCWNQLKVFMNHDVQSRWEIPVFLFDGVEEWMQWPLNGGMC